MRENFLGRVSHPDVLRGPGGKESHLIVDPLADRIVKGDPTLGWEGDARMALYLDPKNRQWELWRLEADNVYRPTAILPADIPGYDAVGQFIMHLARTDSRKGFDVHNHVVAEAIKAEKAKQAKVDQFAGEGADRLAFALKQDAAI